MTKLPGTRYNSKWDKSTWTLLLAVSAPAIAWLMADLAIAFWCHLVICLIATIALSRIHYRIDGNRLLICQLVGHTAYPIDKIKEIKPTKSWLTGPATSLNDRLAITFTDRSILKSAIPLIISPANKAEFIAKLKEISPNITVFSL